MQVRDKLTCPEPKCDFSTRSDGKLVKHIKKVHKKDALKCPFCTTDHYSTNKSALAQHKKREHRNIRLKCCLCEFSTRGLNKWIRHVTQNHSGQTSALFSLFQTEVVSDKTKAKDNVCVIDIPSADDVGIDDLQGRKGHRNNNVSKFKEIDGLRNSSQAQRILSDGGREDINDLDKTLSMAFSSSLKTVKQKNCSENYVDCVTTSHISSTSANQQGSSETVKSCPYCDNNFTSYTLLKEHCEKKHQITRPPYSCRKCKFSSDYFCYLVRHMGTHRAEKPFACHLCSSRFTLKCNLDAHIRKHTEGKQFACSLCSYRCHFKSELVYHFRVHTNERPYKCTMCDYAGKLSSHLVRHMRNHTGEQPYQCKDCGKKFSQQAHVIKHRRNAVCL